MSPDAMRAVEAAVEDVAAGSIVAIEDEAGVVLLAAAELLTPAAVAFMRGDSEREPSVIAADGDGSVALDDRSRAALELVGLAGMRPVAAVSEVPATREWAVGSRLRAVSTAAVAGYRARRRVKRLVDAPVPTPDGVYLAVGYRSGDGREHMAVVKGSVEGAHDVLVVVCPQCTMGHALHSTACLCGRHLDRALDGLRRHERGVIVHVGRGPHFGPDALGQDEAACAEYRRRCASDPIALAIVADLAPGSTRILGSGAEWPAPVRPAPPRMATG